MDEIIDYKNLPPEEKQELAVEIYLDSRTDPDKKPLTQKEVAAMFGRSQEWLSKTLLNAGVIEKIERRTRSNVVLARAMANKAAPEMMRRTIESARKHRGDKFEYINQQDRRDILDRAGVRAEKQEAMDVNITFADGAGFNTGMPAEVE